MTAKTLSLAGFWLVVAAAVILLVINLVVVRAVPRLTLPLMLASWAAGALGFIAVCAVEPSAINIALGVLFVVSIVYHGRRIINRVHKRLQPPNDADAPSP